MIKLYIGKYTGMNPYLFNEELHYGRWFIKNNKNMYSDDFPFHAINQHYEITLNELPKKYFEFITNLEYIQLKGQEL